MPSWGLNAVILVAMVLLLVKVGALLVEAVGAIGEHHRFSKDAIARILAFCSSTPELAIAGISVVEGVLAHNSVVSSIGPYTIVGSAMFNLLLITGGCAFLIQGGIHLGWKPIIRDLGIYFIGLLALYVFLLGEEIQLWQSIVLLGIYILSWLLGRWGTTPHAQEEPRAQATDGSVRLGKRAYWKAFGTVVFALPVILVASHFMISSAVGIATFLRIPPAIIAVTLLAAGASVPDTLSAFHEAKKGEGLIAVLQALQSNSFDVLFTIGFVTLVTTLTFHSPVAVSPNGLYNLVELGASVLIVIVVLGLNKWRLGKLQGVVFILMFIGYWLQQVLFFHR